MMGAPALAGYRAAWALALPALRLASAAGLFPSWRLPERLDTGPGSPYGPGPLWLHCASLGEAKGLWALARSLPPELPLLLTSSTRTGCGYLHDACASAGDGGRRARLAPLDHPGLLGAFLERNRIRGLCLYELEIWPHALMACGARGLPVALASGRIRAGTHAAYRRFGAPLLRLLDRMEWIQAQSEDDRARFASAVRAPVHAGADLKALAFLDGAARPGRAHARTGRRDAFAFVSLHLRELRILLPVLPALRDRGGVLVFPRHPSEFPAFRAALAPLGFAIWSRGDRGPHQLVDVLGKVGECLPACHTAFVGGSLFAPGCHNPWEPLAAGARVVVGPHYRQQRPAVEGLLSRGLAARVAGAAELASLPPPRDDFPAAAAAYAQEAREAAAESMQACRERIIATFHPGAPAPPAKAVPAGGEGIIR